MIIETLELNNGLNVVVDLSTNEITEFLKEASDDKSIHLTMLDKPTLCDLKESLKKRNYRNVICFSDSNSILSTLGHHRVSEIIGDHPVVLIAEPLNMVDIDSKHIYMFDGTKFVNADIGIVDSSHRATNLLTILHK